MAVQYFSNTAPQIGTDTVVSLTAGTGSADFIVGSVFCDQGGTLTIEQSGDNTNFDAIDSFTVTGGTPLKFKVDALLAYARVRMHVTVNATALRLYARTTSSGARP